VLNFAKLESGQIEYRLAPVALESVLRDTESMILPQIAAKNITYTNVGCDPSVVVQADADKLRQILLNLLTNAVKFTHEGGRITISCGQVPQLDDVAARRTFVRVTDTGIGIAQSKLETIFEPFVQVESRASERNDGVGLGLAISRGLARDMGGNLSAESIPDVGTTMTLVLPSV
jgi:signal transduction histidine kinase